jgi:3-keto-5-aminohexanoate cleavage enzyme
VTLSERHAIIQCAVNGGERGPNPHIPVEPERIAHEAIRAARSGASIIHLHAWLDGAPTQDPSSYVAIMDRVREAVPEVIFNLTTTGSIGMPDNERLRPLEAMPEIATLDCGTMNWGNAVLGSSPSFVDRALDEMLARGIRPELHALDVSWLRAITELTNTRSLRLPLIHLYVSTGSGAPWSLGLLDVYAAGLPDAAVVGLTADGGDHFPAMAVALARGWHVRTGLEDVVADSDGSFVKSNAELVERAVTLAEAMGRPVASPSIARELLGLSG